MNGDLISREELLKKECCGRISGDDVRNAPAIDAAPVVHGQWVEKPFLLGTTHVCSECGDYYGMPHGIFNYCPNYGAKMDLE